MTSRVLSEAGLNELELVLGNLLPSLGQINEPMELLDPEQTPVARLDIEGSVEQLRPLGHRPFAELRITSQGSLEGEAVLVLEDVPPDADPRWSTLAGRPIVVLDTGDHDRLGRNVRAARVIGADVRVLPVPERSVRVDAVDLLTSAGAASVEAWETEKKGTGGLVVFLTGLSGSGKSTVARALAERLREEDSRVVTLLDGDEVRTMLSSGLGFSREDRELNIRRIAWVAALVARHGGIAVCAPIAPYESMRADARKFTEDAGGRFVLVHVSTPIEVCEARDRKGLYAQARAGNIAGFTGIDDPYEAPDDPELRIDTSLVSVDKAVETILLALEA